MIPVEKVQLIINKYETLEKELASGNKNQKNILELVKLLKKREVMSVLKKRKRNYQKL